MHVCMYACMHVCMYSYTYMSRPSSRSVMLFVCQGSAQGWLAQGWLAGLADFPEGLRNVCGPPQITLNQSPLSLPVVIAQGLISLVLMSSVTKLLLLKCWRVHSPTHAINPHIMQQTRSTVVWNSTKEMNVRDRKEFRPLPAPRRWWWWWWWWWLWLIWWWWLVVVVVVVVVVVFVVDVVLLLCVVIIISIASSIMSVNVHITQFINQLISVVILFRAVLPRAVMNLVPRCLPLVANDH